MINPDEIAKFLTDDPDVFNEGWDELGIAEPNFAKSEIRLVLERAIAKYNKVALEFPEYIPNGLQQANRAFEQTPEFADLVRRHIGQRFKQEADGDPAWGRDPQSYGQIIQDFLTDITR